MKIMTRKVLKTLAFTITVRGCLSFQDISLLEPLAIVIYDIPLVKPFKKVFWFVF